MKQNCSENFLFTFNSSYANLDILIEHYKRFKTLPVQIHSTASVLELFIIHIVILIFLLVSWALASDYFHSTFEIWTTNRRTKGAYSCSWLSAGFSLFFPPNFVELFPKTICMELLIWAHAVDQNLSVKRNIPCNPNLNQHRSLYSYGTVYWCCSLFKMVF